MGLTTRTITRLVTVGVASLMALAAGAASAQDAAAALIGRI